MADAYGLGQTGSTSGLLGGVPLGCRVVAGICLFEYLFSGLVAECTPFGVFKEGRVLTLITASFLHTHYWSYCVASFLSWKRFVRLEQDLGSLGFLWWILQTSIALHFAYCLICHLMLGTMDPRMYHQPVHGLWPLLLLCFTFDAKRDPYAEVFLWPLPVTVYTRTLPLLALFGAYLVHFSAHMDGLLAVFLAVLLPERPFFAVDEKVLDYFEKSEASWVLSVRGFAGFCRRNDGFKMLPTHGVTSPRGPGSINADGSGGSFGGPGLGGSGYIDTSGDVLGGGQSGSGVSPGHANVFGSAGGAGGENFMSDVVSGVSGVVMGTTAEALRVAPGVLKGGLGAMNVAMQNINQVTNAGVAVLSGSSSQMQAGASMAPGMAGAPAGASSGFTGNFVDTPEASSVLPPQAGAQPGTGPFPIPGPVPPPDTSASAAAAAGARHAAAAGPGVDLSGNASAAGGMTLDGDFDLNDPLENPGAGQANPAFLNAGGATVAPGVNLDLDI
eukprot:gene455-185_t